MKKLIFTGIAIITLSACGTRTVVVENTTGDTAVPNTQKPQTYMSKDETVLNHLTSDYPSEVSILGKVNTLKMVHLTCDAIDEGSTLRDFVALANNNNVDAGFIGAMIREAVANYCPENQWFIDSALNA